MKTKLIGLLAAGALLGALPAFASEISGKVIRADPKAIYLSDKGMLVVLKVDRDTQFEGTNVSRAADVNKGDQIAATFVTNDKQDNVATVVTVTDATGGSGPDPDQAAPKPPNPSSREVAVTTAEEQESLGWHTRAPFGYKARPWQSAR